MNNNNSNNHTKNIRLTQQEISAIKNSFSTTFPQGDSLWIFGSRVNMKALGGDIDLYVQTYSSDAAKIYQARQDFLDNITSKIGEQKIDVVLHFINKNFNLPIYEIAKKEGVKLI